VTAQPVHPNASDRATSDPALLVLTATTDRIAADPVTAREIAEFLRHLAELRGARGGDPTERAAFLARKAELFTRLAAHPTTPARPPEPERRTP
jgi:hypothetical protein